MKNYTIRVDIQSTLRLDSFERMRFGWALARLSVTRVQPGSADSGVVEIRTPTVCVVLTKR
jgi:SpoU rRNA methylase family enzyme